MDLIGFPFTEADEMADMFHRHTYIPPSTPERDQLNADVVRFSGLLCPRALERRSNPTDDLPSYLANIEINGELLSLEEVAGHAFLVLIGGTATTAALLSNTFIHLHLRGAGLTPAGRRLAGPAARTVHRRRSRGCAGRGLGLLCAVGRDLHRGLPRQLKPSTARAGVRPS
jgi:hypothetical protein